MLSKLELNRILNTKVINLNSVSTGLNDAYQITTNNKNYFIKYSKVDNLLNEALELEILGKYTKIPKVIRKNTNYIILEWINNDYNPNFDTQLACNLYNLHNTHSNYFGFEFDNKIGITKQINKKSTNWAYFYWNYRILYQINLAKNKISNKDYHYLLNLENIIKYALDINIKPVLLHGDLWSGNYLTSSNNVYFIDSASYYGHSEVDLSLSYIFGGFNENFYKEYFRKIPMANGFGLRKYIYMLYYYINHFNIFGASYYNSVINCTNKILTYAKI